MKIKNVEISAFRIYDDPKNATFDFTDGKGEIVNFVSLYAPNGFGKTSFYDAVEWAVTKSINRFYIRSQELEKLANFQARQNELPLIHNSKSLLNTFVSVTTDTKKFEESLKKRRNQVHDINFKKPVVHEFQQVILSQEWISAFLTESDGETRYKKFMQKPDLVAMSDYYNNLKFQLSALKDERERLDEEVKEHKNKIIKNSQEDLLSTVNKQIQFIKSDFNEPGLFLISQSTTKEEIKTLKDNIASNQISSSREKVLNALLDNIATAKTGNEKLAGINLFYEHKSSLEDVSTRIKDCKSKLKEFIDLEKNSNELSSCKKAIAEVLESVKVYDELLRLFDGYKKTDDQIRVKKLEIVKLEGQIKPLLDQLPELQKNEITTQAQLDSAIKEFDLIQQKILQLPALKELINKQTIENKTLLDALDLERDAQQSREKELLELNSTITGLKQIKENAAKGVYSITSVKDRQDLITLIEKLDVEREKLVTTKKELHQIDKQIAEQKELSSTIQAFVKSGLAIVNERKTSTCPLCEQSFASYTELAERISKNSGLDAILQELLAKQTGQKVKIAAIETVLKNGQDQLIVFYEIEIAVLDKKLKDLQRLSDDAMASIESKEREFKNGQENLTKNNIQLEGLGIDAFEKSLHVKSTELNGLKENLSDGLYKIKENINKLNEASETLLGQIKLVPINLEALYENEAYKKIIAWFKENTKEGIVEWQILLLKKGEQEARLMELFTKEKQHAELILAKKTELASHTKDGLSAQLLELEAKRVELLRKIEEYQYFLKQLEFDLTDPSKGSLMKQIEAKELNAKSLLDKSKKLVAEYDKLARYCENIADFLQSENARRAMVALNAELDLLNNTIEPSITNEKEKTKEYLQQRIQDFFYEKLINDLYKKIDPHPDFKEVKFQADFESDSPRLDVFVKNKGDESLLIPNLYFSTAQINVLSLSIFLATALNSTAYDCIFIDDPIQSMDSINILSTIDLLRSIVVNHKKQIILSTHDENFHNLLKKKMPATLFKSKFIELESFGKVKK